MSVLISSSTPIPSHVHRRTARAGTALLLLALSGCDDPRSSALPMAPDLEPRAANSGTACGGLPAGTSSLRLIPESNPTIGIGKALDFNAVNQSGLPVPDCAIAWSVSRTTVASISTAGIVVGKTAGGPIEVRAQASGSKTIKGTAFLTVSAVQVASVLVAATTTAVPIGNTAQLTATPRDASGNALTGRVVTWSSANATIATVSNSGLVTAKTVGTVVLTATSEGRSGTIAITVTPIPVSTVTVSPGTGSLYVGKTLQLSAAATASDGTALTDRAITWASSASGVATVSSQGVVTAVGQGTATVTATVDGKIGSAVITVALVPIQTVTVTPASGALLVGQTLSMSASAFDAENKPQTGRTVVWSSSAPAVADISSAGLLTAIAPGTTTVTALVEGKTGTATVTVAPLPSAITGLTVQPTSLTLTVGASSSIATTVSQPPGAPAAVLTYGTTTPAVASITATTGVITAVAPGSAIITVTATAPGSSSFAAATTTQTVAVTVIPVPISTITVSPSTGTLIVGKPLKLTAATLAANGSPLTDRPVTWASSASAVATVNSQGDVTAVAPGTATITATAEGKSGSATITVTLAPIQSVTVTPASGALLVGQTLGLSATAYDAENGVQTGRAVTWSSSAQGVATITSAGLLTASAPGTTTVTAVVEGKVGTATVTVAPLPSAITGLTVSPGMLTLTAGQTATLTSTVNQPSGAPPATVTYGTTTPAVASVTQTTGVVTAVAPGTATITVTASAPGSSSFSAATTTQMVTVTVTAVPVTSVSITPGSIALLTGSSQQLTATALDAAGLPLTGRTATWTIANPSVANVSSSGLVTASMVGMTSVTATIEGRSATVNVTVNAAGTAVFSVTLTPLTTNLALGGTQQFTAVARDASGAVLSNRLTTWTSSDQNVVSINQTGLATGNMIGTAIITATVDGVSGTATVTVGSTPPSISGLTVTPMTVSLQTGRTQSLMTMVSQPLGAPLASVTYGSSAPGVAMVSESGVINTVSPGSATITVTATAPGNGSFTASSMSTTVAVTVTAPTASQVSVSPSMATIMVGGSQQLTATVRDIFTNPIPSATVIWSSSNVNVATVSQTGLVMGMGAGTATITAMSDGVMGTATITVTSEIGSIVVTPSARGLPMNSSQQLTAFVYSQTGTLLTGRTVNWRSSDSTRVTVTQGGLATAIGYGMATITASIEGRSASATLFAGGSGVNVSLTGFPTTGTFWVGLKGGTITTTVWKQVTALANGTGATFIEAPVGSGFTMRGVAVDRASGYANGLGKTAEFSLATWTDMPLTFNATSIRIVEAPTTLPVFTTGQIVFEVTDPTREAPTVFGFDQGVFVCSSPQGPGMCGPTGNTWRGTSTEYASGVFRWTIPIPSSASQTLYWEPLLKFTPIEPSPQIQLLSADGTKIKLVIGSGG